MTTTITGYQTTVRDLPRSLEIVQSDLQVARETDYYLENIGNVKSPEDLVADDRLFRYVMKAHGLEEMNFAKALVKQALEEGKTDSNSIVNRLADARYRDLAESLDFESFGAAATSFDAATQGVVDKYVRQQLEENVGEQNEGVRLALYFKRKAPQLSSTEGILADSALSTVVRQVLQIPEANAFLDIDRQVEQLEERIDVEDFSDPEKLSKFIDRFVAIWDTTNSTPDPAVDLFNQGSAYNVSTDMLLSIQLLK